MTVTGVIYFVAESETDSRVKVTRDLCAREVEYWNWLGDGALRTGWWIGDQLMLTPKIPHDIRTAMMLRFALHTTYSERTYRLTSRGERAMLAYLLACEAEDDGQHVPGGLWNAD